MKGAAKDRKSPEIFSSLEEAVEKIDNRIELAKVDQLKIWFNNGSPSLFRKLYSVFHTITVDIPTIAVCISKK